MELEFSIKINPNNIYDYLLYHMYTSFQGLLGAIAGIFLIMLFMMGQSPVFLIAGLVVLIYLPYTLFLRSRQQYLNTPAFKEPLNYLFDDNGMTISQGESSESVEWEHIVKAVSTPNSILLYTSKLNASIFPKKELGEKKELLIKMISTHLEPKKVKIRG